jgi:DNA transformation protein and related proteins
MPSKNQEFATYCCDLLGAIGPCVLRRMFGGYGISVDGLTVAIMTDLGQGEKLWLKADDDSRARFEAAGCQRFGYLREGVQRGMNYYSAPEEAMDSPQQMAPWARLAREAALTAAVKATSKVKASTQVKPSLKAKAKVKAKVVVPAASKC